MYLRAFKEQESEALELQNEGQESEAEPDSKQSLESDLSTGEAPIGVALNPVAQDKTDGPFSEEAKATARQLFKRYDLGILLSPCHTCIGCQA